MDRMLNGLAHREASACFQLPPAGLQTALLHVEEKTIGGSRPAGHGEQLEPLFRLLWSRFEQESLHDETSGTTRCHANEGMRFDALES